MHEQIEKVINGVTYIGNPEPLFCKGCAGDKNDSLCESLCEGIRCNYNWSKKVIEKPIKVYSTNPDFIEKIQKQMYSNTNPIIPCERPPVPPAPSKPIQGVKYDSDKIKYSLLPSYALEAAAKNLTTGLKKYPERDNWMKVDNAQERYMDALYRHLEAHRKGEIFDTESSDKTNTHLAAVVVNAMFLLEFLLNPKLNGGK